MRVLLTLLGVGLALGNARAGESERWFEHGRAAVEQSRAQLGCVADARAHNLVLFIGDGMGVSTVTAARILAGQQDGTSGEENLLAFERFPHLALAKTYNTNQQTPDSAGTMTAMVTGVKTKAGVLAIGPEVARGDAQQASQHRLETLLERAETRGLATGIVTTTTVTHATPAATYAHGPERDWEDDSKLSEAARSIDFPDIARQLIEFEAGDGIEVVLGGGRRSFLPREKPDPEYGHGEEPRNGRRLDGRDLTAEWSSRPGAAYVWNLEQLGGIDLASTRHLLGLFEPSHMQFEVDRTRDPAGEPSLSEMTASALELLQRHPAGRRRGFVLVVEAGRIDHAHHAGNAARALNDTIELSRAVAVAVERTDPRRTLILVTADHSHTLTIGGYSTRGNPILGLVVRNDDLGGPHSEPERATDGLPYTALGYANGAGARRDAGQRRDLSSTDTAAVDFIQDAAIPTRGETHAAEDVAVYAAGPGAPLVHGVMEQNELFHVMAHALRLDAAPPGVLARLWRRLTGS